MAIVVMAIIIILNIVLLLAVMRFGTKEDHHDQVAAEQSQAVLAWRARLGMASKDSATATDQLAAADDL